MNIAIPVTDLEKNKNIISDGLSATGQICIYNSCTNEATWMKTSDLAANMGELLSALEKKAVSDIITSRIQPMALKVLVNKGFHVYKSIGNLLNENILQFNQKKLPFFDMESAMANISICGGACDICSTDDCQEDVSAKINNAQQKAS
jgi:predicted Fe-Mo cluster-binding NifX family protein